MKFQKPLTIAAALVAVAGYAILGVVVLNQSFVISTLSSNSDALHEQVKDAGETPVAPLSQAVTGTPGEPGKTGATGDRGPGPTAMQIALGIRDYCDTDRVPCKGDPGPEGPASTVPGPAGQNGADSTVPGPSGPPGTDGRDGRDGEPGEPALSWTQPGILGPELCTRTDPFDRTAPTYTCTTITP